MPKKDLFAESAETMAPGLEAAGLTPDRMERLAFLDQWISRRIEEAEAAEARLEKRLGVVAKAEESLRALSESLRRQVAEACPLVAQLQQFKETSQATVQEILSTARAQFSEAAELVRCRLDQLKEAQAAFAGKIEALEQQAKETLGPLELALQNLLAESRRQAQDLLDTLPRSIAARVEVFRKEVERTLEQAKELIVQRNQAAERNYEEFLAQHLADCQEQAQSALAVAQQQVSTLAGQFTQGMEQKAARLSGSLQGTLDSVENDALALANAMEQGLGNYLKRSEEIGAGVERVLQQGDETLRQRTGQFQTLERTIDQRARELQEQWTRAAELFARQSAAELAEMKLALQRQMNGIVEDLRSASAPLLRELHQSSQAAQAQMSQAVEDVRQSLNQRLGELAQSGRTLLDQADQSLATRLNRLRPEVAQAVENAQRLLSERLQGMMDSARKNIELHEEQMSQRIEALRPRIAAAVRGAEADAHARLAKIEQDAIVMTGWMERRLSQRIDELIQRSRRVLGAELASPPAAPVEVEVFVNSSVKDAREELATE